MSTKPPLDTNDEAQKALIKEAIDEWLDKQFAKFGKWSAAGIASALLVALLYFWLATHGWHAK